MQSETLLDDLDRQVSEAERGMPIHKRLYRYLFTGRGFVAYSVGAWATLGKVFLAKAGWEWLVMKVPWLAKAIVTVFGVIKTYALKAIAFLVALTVAAVHAAMP